MRAPPPPPASIWSLGSRTLTQAQDETGISKQELIALCESGVLVWMRWSGRRTRLIAWKSIVDYLDGQHADFQADEEQTAGAGARTGST